jgi:glycerol-3-phosphate acyltransferase PlsX
MLKIGFDIMGGDFAPEQAIKGVAQYLEECKDQQDVHLLLIGNPETVGPFMSLLDAYQGRFTLVPAPDVIGMHEHPTKALKEKQQSSIAIGFGMMQMGKTDAFISAGNTGAMMVGSMYSVKTIEGILRPTIMSPVPRTDGTYSLLLDVGANADCKPEHLVQFAQLGSIYANKVWGVENPKVGLINLGEEEGKGNILAQATYPLLKENKSINFVGNIEGFDMFTDKADVLVCEGFTGNVALKMAESVYHILTRRGLHDPFLDQFNYEFYGGTPILGINSPVIIGHGISSALAFRNMIDVAAKIVRADLIGSFKKHFAVATDAS